MNAVRMVRKMWVPKRRMRSGGPQTKVSAALIQPWRVSIMLREDAPEGWEKESAGCPARRGGAGGPSACGSGAGASGSGDVGVEQVEHLLLPKQGHAEALRRHALPQPVVEARAIAGQIGGEVQEVDAGIVPQCHRDLGEVRGDEDQHRRM